MSLTWPFQKHIRLRFLIGLIVVLIVGGALFSQLDFYASLFYWTSAILHKFDGYDAVMAWKQESVITGEGEDWLREGLELARRHPKYSDVIYPENIRVRLEEIRLYKQRVLRESGEKARVWAECILALQAKARRAILQDQFVESDLWHLFVQWERPDQPCSQDIDPSSYDQRQIWASFIIGAVRIPQGVVLRRLHEDYVWADSLYRVEPNRLQRWQEVGADPYRVSLGSPDVQVQQAYKEVVAGWGPNTARLLNNRSHRLYQAQQYAAAKEVIQYALRLDPHYNMAWYNAAAYAARDNDAFHAMEFLRHYLLPGQKLLRKVRSDPDFEGLLTTHSAFRHFLYTQGVEPHEASSFLRSFSMDLDYSRSVGCGPDDMCESLKEVHTDLVLTRPQASPEWRLVLQQEMNEEEMPNSEDIFIHMTDIEERLFIAFNGKAYEVNLDPPVLIPLGKADLISDTHERFPLVLAKRDQKSSIPTWHVALYNGEKDNFVVPRDCYQIASVPKDSNADAFWHIEKAAQGFNVHDDISGKVYLLESCSH